MRASGYAIEPDQWYQEQPQDVEDLIRAMERDNLPLGHRMIWDPAAGEGTIPDKLWKLGYKATGSDLIDRGAGFLAKDFMSFVKAKDDAQTILSNPPFKPIEDWTPHGLQLCHRVIFLARLALLEGQKRRDNFWSVYPPVRVWVCSRRPSIPPGGRNIKPTGGSIPMAWYEWRRGWRGIPQIHWI